MLCRGTATAAAVLPTPPLRCLPLPRCCYTATAAAALLPRPLPLLPPPLRCRLHCHRAATKLPLLPPLPLFLSSSLSLVIVVVSDAIAANNFS
jgi:hypothetical protein